MKRRTFLLNSAKAGLALSILPACSDNSGMQQRQYKYGLQLYTVRDELKNGLDTVIEKISALGYESIELFGYDKGMYFGNTITATKEMLLKHNLIVPSAHIYNTDFLFEGNDDVWKKAIEDANVLEQQYLVIPWLQEDKRQTADDYKKLSSRLNRAGELCKASGLKFAYHNHDFEFAPIEGTTGYDIIRNETDAELVKLEVDLFWVVFAGIDPKVLMKDLAGRARLWHIKDMNPETRTNIEIGKGIIDFKSLLNEAKTWGVEHYFVEQENYTVSPFDSIEKSIAYMKEIAV